MTWVSRGGVQVWAGEPFTEPDELELLGHGLRAAYVIPSKRAQAYAIEDAAEGKS